MTLEKRGDCPQFEDHNWEQILGWAQARVELEDDPLLKRRLWSMTWRRGTVSFNFGREDDEPQARKAAALFIYLWVQGVEAALALRCAEAYVKTYTVRSIQ